MRKLFTNINFINNHTFFSFIGVVLLILIIVSVDFRTYADSSPLRINEFSREWVELKNYLDEPIDPTQFDFGCNNYEQTSGDGGPILDNSGAPLLAEIPPHGIIWMPIDGICGNLGDFYANGILKVSGNGGMLTDEVIYGNGELSQVLLPQVGQSASLINDSWQISSSPTKGLENTSSNFLVSTSTIFRSGQGNWEVPNSKFVTNGDYDGDGFGEIAVMYDYGNEDIAIIIFKTVGNQVETRTIFRSGPGNWDISRTKYLISEDYDNDGKSEIAAMYDYGGGDMALIVFQ